MVSTSSATHLADSELRTRSSQLSTNPVECAGTQLRVLVVTEVRLFQEGIASVLGQQERVDVIGATDMPHAVAKAAELQPDIVLFDASRRESVEDARNLAASLPDAKIVAFGVAETKHDILALAAAGTAGYVCNDAAPKDVVRLLDRVMRDELVCSPFAAASLYRQVALLSQSGGSKVPDFPVLSRRELEVCYLIERGLSNKEIGRKLGIESTTAKNHVHNILDKLKLRRRSEAADWARNNLKSLSP
jgi:two-component system, NarL family, nitrate/nitrite response regulator NarL